MDIWKVIAGAAIGVGAVAAAPFTGGGSLLGGATLLGSLAGAGTIAAAAGLGAAGAAAGAYMKDDDDLREEGRNKGRMEADAEHSIRFQKIMNSLEQYRALHTEVQDYFRGIYAMQAVALAVAHCDGEVCESEQQQINEFLSGISGSQYPVEAKAKIQALADNPVTLNEAFLMAKESGLPMETFDEIIYVTAHADGIYHQHEQAFMDAWSSLRAA